MAPAASWWEWLHQQPDRTSTGMWTQRVPRRYRTSWTESQSRRRLHPYWCLPPSTCSWPSWRSSSRSWCSPYRRCSPSRKTRALSVPTSASTGTACTLPPAISLRRLSVLRPLSRRPSVSFLCHPPFLESWC